jgi:hypothetical protein
MTIKQLGGVFGRNPTFNDVTIEGELTFDGDIDVNSDLKVDGDLVVTGKIGVGTDTPSDEMEIRSTSPKINFTDSSDDTSGSVGYNVRALMMAADGTHRFYIGGDEKVRILETSGDVSLLGGGNLVVNSGSGIDFSATAGTGTSELFSDYEEGTWTPTAADAISGGTTSTTGSGSYTKIGNFIMVTAALVNIDTTGMTAGNTFHIQGLPFASGDVPLTTAYYINSGVFTSAVTTASPVQSWINDTGVSALYFYDSSGTILVSDITSGAGDFYFTAIYQTA